MIFSERGVGPCAPLDVPENAAVVIYHEPKAHQKKLAKIAEAMCKPGYFPDLSNGQKLKTVCKIVKDKKTGESSYKWIRGIPKCVSCDLQPGEGLEDKIKAGIDDPVGADVFCSYNRKSLIARSTSNRFFSYCHKNDSNQFILERNEHHCILQCLDDRKKVDHNVLSRTQKRANIDCRCKKGDCSWTTHGKTDIALKGKIRQKLSEFVVLSCPLDDLGVRVFR